MTAPEQRKRADDFLALHHATELLILPNAWDVISARLYETEGFKAIGTTSAGVAAVLGYPDGERISRDEMVEAVGRIARRLDVPLSADMETGYGISPEAAAKTTELVMSAGAVGINLEDGKCDSSGSLIDTSLHAEKIAAVRQVATSAGIHLVINARTDVFLVSDEASPSRIDEATRRAAAYKKAGADCIFVPDVGSLNADTIATLVRNIDSPINLLAGPDMPTLPELHALGVARVSFGPRPMRAALALVCDMAREWLNEGTYGGMATCSLSYDDVNRMLA